MSNIAQEIVLIVKQSERLREEVEFKQSLNNGKEHNKSEAYLIFELRTKVQCRLIFILLVIRYKN